MENVFKSIGQAAETTATKESYSISMPQDNSHIIKAKRRAKNKRSVQARKRNRK